jgi:hypothetical protein
MLMAAERRGSAERAKGFKARCFSGPITSENSFNAKSRVSISAGVPTRGLTAEGVEDSTMVKKCQQSKMILRNDLKYQL